MIVYQVGDDFSLIARKLPALVGSFSKPRPTPRPRLRDC